MNPNEWLEQGKRFLYRGRRIFYRDEGQGDAILCVHGWPTSSWDFHRIWPRLVAQHRVVAPDALGSGFSEKPREHSYSIDDWADQVIGLAQALALARVHLLLHDYAVSVGQELLARAQSARLPFAIRSVCFLNGGLFPEVYRPRPVQRLLSSPVGGLAVHALNRRIFAWAFSRVFGRNTRPTAVELDEFWELLTRDGGLRIQHKLCRQMMERTTRRARWVGALETTRVPLRFINGPEDPNSGGHMADRFEELVPKPDVVRLAGIGHYPHMEAPDATSDAYLAFIR